MSRNSAEALVKCTFSNGQTAGVLDIPNGLGYKEALLTLGLNGPVPSAVVIGGASNMSLESQARLLQIFRQVLAPMAETLGITVFDGGTDAGVIQMMGQARHYIGGSFNLVGVVPRGKANLPSYLAMSRGIDTHPEARTDLEPHHTHFILVPGTNWGSESKWLAEFASALAGRCPSITLLINGGKVSLVDLQINLSAGRQALVLSGSGRLADKIAAAINGNAPADDPAIQALVKTYYPQQLSVFDLSSPPDSLTHRLHTYFTLNT